MSQGVSLKPNAFYHIYLSGEYPHTLFSSGDDYQQFLHLYATHMTHVVETYAYCLLPNHFHFFVRVRTLREQVRGWLTAKQAAADFQPAYPQDEFARLLTEFTALHLPLTITRLLHRQQFAYLIRYIHQNPTLHGNCDNFREWRWSSYKALLTDQPTRIPVHIVMRWFYSVEWFEELHWETQDMTQLGYLIVED